MGFAQDPPDILGRVCLPSSQDKVGMLTAEPSAGIVENQRVKGFLRVNVQLSGKLTTVPLKYCCRIDDGRAAFKRRVYRGHYIIDKGVLSAVFREYSSIALGSCFAEEFFQLLVCLFRLMTVFRGIIVSETSAEDRAAELIAVLAEILFKDTGIVRRFVWQVVYFSFLLFGRIYLLFRNVRIFAP